MMKSNSSSNLEMVPEAKLAPTAERDRIQVLDLIRAIALLGIFLVNVEFFNRQLGERGLPIDVTGCHRPHLLRSLCSFAAIINNRRVPRISSVAIK